MSGNTIVANGKIVETELPISIEGFLMANQLMPKSVVVEHNGHAVAPSEFKKRALQPGDRIEIVKIVAGG